MMICPFCGKTVERVEFEADADVHYVFSKHGDVIEETMEVNPDKGQFLLDCCGSRIDEISKDGVTRLLLDKAVLVPLRRLRNKKILFQGEEIWAVLWKGRVFLRPLKTHSIIWAEKHTGQYFRLALLYDIDSFKFYYPECLQNISPILKRRLREKALKIDDEFLKIPEEWKEIEEGLWE